MCQPLSCIEAHTQIMKETWRNENICVAGGNMDFFPPKFSLRDIETIKKGKSKDP